MLKIFIFIFLGLFVNVDNVYSQFFMPEGARSDTTSIVRTKPISRISNNSKSERKSKEASLSQEQIKKQKPARKLFMAIRSEGEKKDNVYEKTEPLNEISERDAENKNRSTIIFQKKEAPSLNQEKPLIEKRVESSTNNIFDRIEREHKEDLINIGNGTYKGNPRIDKVLSDFKDVDHRL